MPKNISDNDNKNLVIDIIDYNDKKLEEKKIEHDIEECIIYKKSGSISWINVDGLNNAEQITRLSKCFDLHHIIVKDILNSEQRPKFENMGDYLFLSVQMVSLSEGEIENEQVSFIVGKNFLLSFQEKENGDVFDPIREKLKDSSRMIRSMGSDYLLYSLLNSIIDNYFNTLEKLGERIEFLEEKLISSPDQNTLQEIHEIKQKMLFLRRSIWPLREVIAEIEREETNIITQNTKIYYRDLYNHTIQVIDIIEMYRDMVSGMIDIYLSSINNKMNEIVKVLTVITTIFMPLSFIAGVYGMNFHFMPEIPWRYGYVWALGLMLTISISMLFFFRKKKWM